MEQRDRYRPLHIREAVDVNTFRNSSGGVRFIESLELGMIAIDERIADMNPSKIDPMVICELIATRKAFTSVIQLLDDIIRKGDEESENGVTE